MTTAAEAIHRPMTPPAAVPLSRHGRTRPEATGGLHREPPTLPLPIQTRPQPNPPSASMTRVHSTSWAPATTGGQTSPRARSPFTDHTRYEHPYRPGRHRLISPCSG
jgi:hypothetical protein